MKTFEGAQTMEKVNVKTYLFPNITVVTFSLVNAIYLVGVPALVITGGYGFARPGEYSHCVG